VSVPVDAVIVAGRMLNERSGGTLGNACAYEILEAASLAIRADEQRRIATLTEGDELPWPPWLEGLNGRERIQGILSAVVRCCTWDHSRGEAPGEQHCTAVMAEHFLARMLLDAVATERHRHAAGVSLDDPGPEEERLGLYRLAAADGALAERERWQAKLDAIRALLTSGPIGRSSGERYIRADLIRGVLDSQPEHLREPDPAAAGG
jgi:hypothetical protein